jgi:hypothetical protein
MDDTNKMTALQSLANSLPVANSRLAAGQKAARDMQLQQAVAGAPPAAPIAPTAQTGGAAAATNAGQSMIANAKQGVAEQGQVAQLGATERAQTGQAEVASQSMGAKQAQMDQATEFANLNEGLKKQLYDNTMQFQKDELGRTKFNEMQMADYYKVTAQNQEQFKNYSQQIQQATDRNIQMMEKAHQLVMEDFQSKYAAAKEAGDDRTMAAIQKAKFDADQAIQKEKNRAASRAAAWSTGGAVVGGVVGAVYGGGPVGAAAGAGVGSAVGGGIGGATQKI